MVMFDAKSYWAIKRQEHLDKLRDSGKMTEAERLYKMKTEKTRKNAEKIYQEALKPLLEQRAESGFDFYDWVGECDSGMINYLSSMGFFTTMGSGYMRISWAPVARDYLE